MYYSITPMREMSFFVYILYKKKSSCKNIHKYNILSNNNKIKKKTVTFKNKNNKCGFFS